MIKFLNFLGCKLLYPFIYLKGSKIYLSWFRISKGNVFKSICSYFSNTRINVYGLDNKLIFNNCQISNTLISITGKNNLVELEAGVNLRKGNIIIRGDNCKVKIDQNTTFGSVRIVNVGADNEIYIGQDCLFSDNIEIWASDSHAIYDVDGKWINREKPITIGNKVWVGSGVTILKGVIVSDGAIIGMGSIITKNIGAKTIVAGNPPKVVKENITWSLDYPTHYSE